MAKIDIIATEYREWDYFGDDIPNGPPPGSPGSNNNGTPENILTKRWIDVRWAYTEPEPKGACTGFELAIMADVSGGAQLVEPIITIESPAARRYIGIVELRMQVNIVAAVRACYGEERSAWREANYGALFTPDMYRPPDYTSGSGWRELGDGLIMQWTVTPATTSQELHTVTWPRRFPNECLAASVTTQTPNGSSPTLASWFSLVSKSATGCTLYIRRAGSGDPLRANIIVFGY
ncbi:MAG: hypothetical protein LBC63_09360 [Holophagales bacterium]|jgi:hypothetical protein|nr:hypothetical protein [Holophagales bacterium]